MSTGYQIDDQQSMHFVTLQVVQWIYIFTRQVYRDIVLDSLIFCRKQKGLDIYAYVIMSNHIHLLIGTETNRLSDILRDFKGFTAKQIIDTIQKEEESRKIWMLRLFEFEARHHIRNAKYQFWTHENHAEIIYSQKFIQQKINYIHDNPVRAGIVENPEDYLYSSARNYAGLSSLLDVEIMLL